jgi:hypothetical protein
MVAEAHDAALSERTLYLIEGGLKGFVAVLLFHGRGSSRATPM